MEKTHSPFFSIIIPVYNVEPYIAQCLSSCINQTFKDIEIVVIDNNILIKIYKALELKYCLNFNKLATYLKSLQYSRIWKTFVRIGLYLLSFGKIKL